MDHQSRRGGTGGPVTPIPVCANSQHRYRLFVRVKEDFCVVGIHVFGAGWTGADADPPNWRRVGATPAGDQFNV